MKKIKIWSTLILLLLCFTSCKHIVSPSPIEGTEKSLSYLYKPNTCEHGLHYQPNGPFAVFVFCDDAGGTNIGIILTEPGAYPGKSSILREPLHNNKFKWDNYAWDLDRRFWQENSWASDIINFAWSPSGRYLYVTTSSIYGDGGIFKLNLLERKVDKIIPKQLKKYLPNIRQYEYYSYIDKIDINQKTITVAIDFGGVIQNITEEIPFE